MFDRLGEYLGKAMNEQTSRRSMLGKLGSVVLAALGFSVFGALPVVKSDVAEATHYPSSNCSNGSLCGIGGQPCESCHNIKANSCPYSLQNSWTSCCNVGGLQFRYMTYRDCCSTSSTAACTSGTWCSNASQPSWCYSGYRYICTVVIAGATC